MHASARCGTTTRRSSPTLATLTSPSPEHSLLGLYRSPQLPLPAHPQSLAPSLHPTGDAIEEITRPIALDNLMNRARNNVKTNNRVFGAMAGVLTFGLGAARPLLNMRMHGPIAAHRLGRDMGPCMRMSSVTHSAYVSPAPPGLSASRPWAVTALVEGDRVLWSWLARLWPAWRHSLKFVRPRTVLNWQKRRFRDHWRRKSQRDEPLHRFFA